ALERGPPDARIGDAGAERVRLEAVRPVGANDALVLIAEEDAERFLSLTDRAASKLFVSSFLISLAAVGLLLGFAAWLSWRIRRLSRAAQLALGDEANRVPPLPEQRAADELGELSRNFSRLLEQIGEYNDYLKNLGSRLTHELLTPMAVIRTSLENMQAEAGDERYLQRARVGIDRLQAMVTALGAATRMEQAIAATESERFDLARLLQELGEALQAAHRDRNLQLRIPHGPCMMTGAPDLLAQMVDKLIENALDFCPADGRIWISLASDGGWLLEVGNTGSRLPDGLSDRLFESMTSVRRDAGAEPHLGLGLYIVRLIARHHGGQVYAENLTGDAGVCFRVRLPAADSAP
ncbi:MAG: ATP-binding protein, partial [Gammaproteobacteria bacterium]